LRRTLNPGALATVSSRTFGVWLSVDAVPAPATGRTIRVRRRFAQSRNRDATAFGERVAFSSHARSRSSSARDDTAFRSDEDLEHGDCFLVSAT